MKRIRKENVAPKPPTSAPTVSTSPPSTPLTTITNEEVKKTLEGLMHILEMAMPDTYFQSDTRVNRARKILKKLERAS